MNLGSSAPDYQRLFAKGVEFYPFTLVKAIEGSTVKEECMSDHILTLEEFLCSKGQLPMYYRVTTCFCERRWR